MFITSGVRIRHNKRVPIFSYEMLEGRGLVPKTARVQGKVIRRPRCNALRRVAGNGGRTGGDIQADKGDPDLLESGQDGDVRLYQFTRVSLHTENSINHQIVGITD